MITTTEYIQRLTITTDDAGHVTTTRSHHADTNSVFWFTELSEEAQARAVRDAISEEESAYCSGNPCQMYFTEYEIIDAARDLEKHQPVEFAQDQGCSWYGTARGEWWHHAADWQSVTEQADTGICYSMDICDTWNKYAARIVALQEAHEEATDRAWIHHENADTAHDNGAHEIEEAERRRATFYEDMAERIENAAEELTEEAARAVGDTIDGLIESQRDYYQSDEFWRERLTDSDERYTREGIRI